MMILDVFVGKIFDLLVEILVDKWGETFDTLGVS